MKISLLGNKSLHLGLSQFSTLPPETQDRKYVNMLDECFLSRHSVCFFFSSQPFLFDSSCRDSV